MHWDGQIMGNKSMTKRAKQEKLRAKELAGKAKMSTVFSIDTLHTSIKHQAQLEDKPSLIFYFLKYVLSKIQPKRNELETEPKMKR